ncbi:hypothetical protein [Clostridium beijerinckii]|uniref:hypothetical protein n=1 Tax=Clostridium beijerinckii TaxID=1520 RepID=UPI001DC9F51E|nr:hypothetical protein [Clostridium beijerinckii]NRW10292.1 hypothetical protein [Clostridium beijerinckii]NRW93845.1 hypothetical protein [Clostridium beijerinckii]
MEEQEFVEKMKTKDENAFIYMVDVYKKEFSPYAIPIPLIIMRQKIYLKRFL